MGAGNRTHVSGIKSIAGTEKILVSQKPVHNVSLGGKRKEGGQKDFARSRLKAGLSFTVCGGEQSHPPTSLHLPALSSYKLQVPGRPLICFAVQKTQSTGFPFLFACLELKWGSVSRHEGEEGEGAGCKRSLCKRDPVEGKSSGGFRWEGDAGIQGVWGCQDPCFLISEFFCCAWVSLANQRRR